MKYQKSKIILHLILLVCVLIFVLGVFNKVEAAVLYLESNQNQYHLGDTFVIEAKIDPVGECINTVAANLHYDKNLLEAIEVSYGESILLFWVEKPQINQSLGSISFIGGVPGGYCGDLSGEKHSPNLLLKIVFKAIGQGTSTISFAKDAQVLLNDSLGTPAPVNFQDAQLTILPKVGAEEKNEWEQILLADQIPPEPFEIELRRDPLIFEGKWFITFFTTDKQTGIDHYDVQEGKGEWRVAESPYLLANQHLMSIIKVRAVDKAGNERIVELVPPYWLTWKIWALLILLILAVTGAIYWLIKKSKFKYQKSK